MMRGRGPPAKGCGAYLLCVYWRGLKRGGTSCIASLAGHVSPASPPLVCAPPLVPALTRVLFLALTRALFPALTHALFPPSPIGLSKCAFRPSDDATTLPYLIPANAMTVVELERFAAVLDRIGGFPDVAARARSLAVQMRAAINAHGIVDHPVHGRIYAYEVDCYSSSYIMDDANIPSLLALPYLGYVTKNDATYLRTRDVILSENNPFYFSGSAGAGIGGPHVGLGYIWPMGLAVQGITSNQDAEIVEVLNTLKTSTADTYLMHESFWKDNPNDFTRSWFAWANSIFAELILTVAEERPYLIFSGVAKPAAAQ